MILFYKDPKKRFIQIIEIVILLLALPPAIFYGGKTWASYQMVLESERHFEEGHALTHQEKWKQAIEAFDRCIEVNPRYFPAYEAKADILLTVMKKPKEAGAVLESGLQPMKDDPRINMELGEYYLTVTKDYKKAQAQLRDANTRMPDNLTCQGLLKKADEMVASRTN